ncbi:VOC family protein [Specibacter sp. RAF43]|uniref:VOC family protein n=1 Tax=Specibacter sp. RAF43 TaxID=3233057 RepID=UPI003F9BE787
MAKITEFLTVNIAVESLAHSIPQYEALGLGHLPAAPWPEPPIEMTDVTFEIPPTPAALSLIEPWKGGGAVGKFIEKRGPGVYSIAVRVDDLEAAMRDWSAAGMEWVMEVPAEVPEGRAARYVADRVTVNWVKPKSFGGVLLEVFEIKGNVRLHPDSSAANNG